MIMPVQPACSIVDVLYVIIINDNGNNNVHQEFAQNPRYLYPR